MRRKTTEEFIEDAKKVHGNKYDYSLVEYNTVHVKVIIICHTHGNFEQTPKNHLKGQNCKKCVIKSESEKRRLGNGEFIRRAKIIHGDKYIYDNVNYITKHTKVDIVCKKHGLFRQRPNDYLRGQGRNKCAKKYSPTNSEFIQIAKQIHGDKYDYSFIDYKNNKTKVRIFCKKCNKIFEQIPIDHIINGSGCPKCGGTQKLSIKEFIEKANNTHGNLYDYSNVIYKDHQTKVNIICKKHNKSFTQTPNSHLGGSGCPYCMDSKGEKKIMEILDKIGLNYITQKTFPDCKYKQKLHFDFYLTELNILIEYDGIQHFKPVEIFGGEKTLKETKIRDKIKNNYCKDNNIQLYRIRYDENIEERLNIILKEYLLLK